MKKLIDHLKNNPGDINKLPEKYKVYFDSIPIDKLESASLRKDDLDRRLENSKKNNFKETQEIITEVYNLFEEGKVYTKNEIKHFLSGVYKTYSAKATDISRYFEVTRARITNKQTGKQDEGFRLIKKKY